MGLNKDSRLRRPVYYSLVEGLTDGNLPHIAQDMQVVYVHFLRYLSSSLKMHNYMVKDHFQTNINQSLDFLVSCCLKLYYTIEKTDMKTHYCFNFFVKQN